MMGCEKIESEECLDETERVSNALRSARCFAASFLFLWTFRSWMMWYLPSRYAAIPAVPASAAATAAIVEIVVR